jgi:hypothetical protein
MAVFTAESVCTDSRSASCGYYYPGMMKMVRLPKMDMWAHARIDNVVDTPTTLSVHLASKWAREPYLGAWRTTEWLYFKMMKEGVETYHVPPRAGASVAWRTYTMPVNGTFLTAGLHTHGEGPTSKMWVVQGSAEGMLPPGLLGGLTDHERVGLQSNEHPSAIPLAWYGLDESAVIRAIMGRPERIMCAYESVNKLSRQGVKVALPPKTHYYRCSGWKFVAGSQLSLIAVNANNTEPIAFRQHHHWVANAQLQLPDHVRFAGVVPSA